MYTLHGQKQAVEPTPNLIITKVQNILQLQLKIAIKTSHALPSRLELHLQIRKLALNQIFNCLKA